MASFDATIVVRAERESDRGRVYEVQLAAFGCRDEAELVEALRERARPQLSLVAEEAGRVVGHVFFSPVEIDPPGRPVGLAGLAPLGVEPARQGRGIGSALVRAGLERCPGLGWQAVFLLGDPAYYGRFGFVAAAPLGFTYGDPGVDPALQVIELRAGALAGRSGRVCYHAAFAESGGG